VLKKKAMQEFPSEEMFHSVTPRGHGINVQICDDFLAVATSNEASIHRDRADKVRKATHSFRSGFFWKGSKRILIGP
jgi:hypothetical protein